MLDRKRIHLFAQFRQGANFALQEITNALVIELDREKVWLHNPGDQDYPPTACTRSLAVAHNGSRG